MKVRISSIGPSGLPIETPLPLEPLQQRLQEGSACSLFVTSPPAVYLMLKRLDVGASCVGTVVAQLSQECGRCTEPKERDLTVEISYTLLPRSRQRSDDDVGLAFYEGDHIDLEPLLQEAIILTLSPYWSPPVAGGRCSLCGLASPLDHPLGEEPSHRPFASLLSFKK